MKCGIRTGYRILHQSLGFRIFCGVSNCCEPRDCSVSDCIRAVPRFFECFAHLQRDLSRMDKSGSSATEGALRPARHLSENASKHPEKSGTSESKPAMNKPPTRSSRKHGYKMRKLKNGWQKYSLSSPRESCRPPQW